jgi:leucyl aminopeptidase
VPSFTQTDPAAVPIRTVTAAGYESLLASLPEAERAWLKASGFEAKPGRSALLPGPGDALAGVLLVVGDPAEPWDIAPLPGRLPEGGYRLADGPLPPGVAVLGWGLGSYRFERYRKPERAPARLVVPEGDAAERARIVAESVCLARDLINTPANDMGPEELAGAVEEAAERFGARYTQIVGEQLLAAGYPLIHAVGRASTRTPRLVELVWGEADAPRLTLIGKGVCFDTGGLDIKPASNMLLMKKDMGGAAVMLGLAQAVMALGLPVRLRLLVPAVENAISGAAFRPGDVLPSRKGITVEVGNTDAEGRLVLADALAEADREEPDLMLDAATLTGAARVALGADLPALFTPDDDLAQRLIESGTAAFDPLWRLPLHPGYREMLKSAIADVSSTGSSGFAGAVTAALFLQRFVERTRSWAHLDIYGHNQSDRPGRPKGGEAHGLRAMLALIERRFGAG